MPASLLTRVQDGKIIEFIEEFQRAYPGISPSFREMMAGVEIHSTGTMKNRLLKLAAEDKLAIYREFLGFRCIMLADTILLTREDAEKVGITPEIWSKLVGIKRRAERKMEQLLDPP